MIDRLKLLPLYFSSPNHCSTAEKPQRDKSNVTGTVCPKISSQDLAFITFDDTFVENSPHSIQTCFQYLFNMSSTEI